MKLLPLLSLVACACAYGEVTVAVGDISDRRTTGQFFSGLDIELKVSGPELAECKGMRLVVKNAEDDTGKALEKKKSGFDSGKFEMPQKAFGGFNRNKKEADEYQLKLEFENPPRSAKALKEITGAVQLLIPSKDPQSIISVDYAQGAGKPVTNESLKAAGVELTLGAAKGNDVSYTLKDPSDKVATIEFCSADGKALETQGRMSSSMFGGPKNISISLKDAPPAGMVTKIYLVTAKSVVEAPIALRNVALP